MNLRPDDYESLHSILCWIPPSALIQPSDNSRDVSFGDLLNAPKATLEGFEGAITANPEQDPQIVAEAIVNLIATPAGSRKFRTTVYMMGWGAAIDP